MTPPLLPYLTASQLRQALVVVIRHLRLSAARLPEDTYGEPIPGAKLNRTAMAAEHLLLAADLERALLNQPPKAGVIDCTPFVSKATLQLGLRIDDLDGAALYTGDVIVDTHTRLQYVVIDHERAICRGLVSRRKDGGWSLPAQPA